MAAVPQQQQPQQPQQQQQPTVPAVPASVTISAPKKQVSRRKSAIGGRRKVSESAQATLETAFNFNPHPSAGEMRRLGEVCGESIKAVSNWYNYRRKREAKAVAKEKAKAARSEEPPNRLPKRRFTPEIVAILNKDYRTNRCVCACVCVVCVCVVRTWDPRAPFHVVAAGCCARNVKRLAL